MILTAVITLFLAACYLWHRRGFIRGYEKGYQVASLEAMRKWLEDQEARELVD
jgi:hypothetical protein